jgi:hypothetical protein
MTRYLQVGVEGGAIWPREETKIHFGGHELILKPATKTTEQSIHINLRGITDIEALTLINRFLSILSWCDDQAMENLYGWSGNPIPVSVPKRQRIIGTSITFPFSREVETDQKAKLALALYREGKTIKSVPFEFLSYFKIMNIFWKDKYIKDKNEIIEGIREVLPSIKNDLAQKRLRELSKSESDVPKYLYESGRCAIAHTYAEPIVDPDDVSDLRRLSQDMWIIKAIAELLIVNKLCVSRSILG